MILIRVWRSRKAKKDRQRNGQMKKDKNTTQKTKDWLIRTPLKRLLYMLYNIILGFFKFVKSEFFLFKITIF
jgi:hypothetical protein